MPTPVSTARQWLTEEAAVALDAAVAIARRRSHTQTTSLHAVSALLSLPSSSLLRDACSRSHSAPYSPRLQFRALELCVGVSLDRLPTSKSAAAASSSSRHDEDDTSSSPPPPVSNSLMAAIKRSQANQRRQPEMYQIPLHTSTTNPISSISSAIKVELKNFVVSILDDPIVSRVLGDAGFRSNDIKLAILHPPVPPPSSPAARFLRAAAAASRFPPPPLSGFPFPFSGAGGGNGAGEDYGSYYCRRIGEILAKARGTGRNPLLVGVCAAEALATFQDCVEKKNNKGMLPAEISGLDFVSVEKELQGFVAAVHNDEGEGENREKLDSKFEELISMLEKHSGPGLVVSYGDLKLFLAENINTDTDKYLLSKLSSLVERFGEKVWLIGSTASSDTYKMFLEHFPSLEKDWDLQSLPVTSSRSSVGGWYSKSSLLGSFVPFGGFFSSPSDFRNPLGGVINQPFSRCTLCNDKYNQELSALMEGGCSASVADRYSSTLPSWLLMKETNPSRPQSAGTETPDDNVESSAKIMGLQKKWNDICQRLHHPPKISSTIPCSVAFLDANNYKQGGTNGNLHSSDRMSSSFDSCCQAIVAQTTSLQRSAPVASLAENFSSRSKLISESPMGFIHHEGDDSAVPTDTFHSPNLHLPSDHKSPSSVSTVTTDLGLGTSHASPCQEVKRSICQVETGTTEHFSSSVATHLDNRSHKATVRSDLCMGDKIDQEDYKHVLKKLTEKVPWQGNACQAISQIVSSCRRRRGTGSYQQPSAVARGLWISLGGPDKMGKKRMALALADILFGSRESVVDVDLSSQERPREPNLMFYPILPCDLGVRSGRKTAVDFMADELRKKPHSVVLLENVDQADDLVVHRSLSRAIQTGRLQDSHGREISIANAIFIMTHSGEERNVDESCTSVGADITHFTEERILGSQIWQMKIAAVGVDTEKDARVIGHSPRLVALSSGDEGTVNKRKLSQSGNPSLVQKKPRCLLDLNVPLEDVDEVDSIETDTFSDPSQTWWADFQDHVEGKVSFVPFNFDAVAEKLMSRISLTLEKKLGSGVRLEIDQEVMVQMLGAAWSSDKEGAVQDWIEDVLGGAFAEAQRRHCLEGRPPILKLVPCPGVPVDKLAPGICLPRYIKLH